MAAPARRITLTPNQQKQVSSAPPSEKAKLAQAFRAQSALLRMPRASAGKRGVMPDVTKYHFGQTPASSNVIAPRGFGYYDAFAHDPNSACTAYSIGPATGVTGTSRHTVNTQVPNASHSGVVLVIVAPSWSKTQGVVIGADSAGSFLSTDINSPQLIADPPQSAIPTRCSLRLRNVSPTFTKGGIVRSLRITTGFLPPTNLAELDSTCELIRNHDRTRTYSGAVLTEDFQINCTVSDQAKATSFFNWVPPASSGFASATYQPALTPIVLLFEPFSGLGTGSPLTATPNTYEITIRSQFLGRYTQGSMLANLAVPPRAIGDGVNNLRDREEARGSTLHSVAQAGVEAGGNFLSNFLSNLDTGASQPVTEQDLMPYGTQFKALRLMASGGGRKKFRR